eukprot:1927937-Rhodomonas_salina.1
MRSGLLHRHLCKEICEISQRTPKGLRAWVREALHVGNVPFGLNARYQLRYSPMRVAPETAHSSAICVRWMSGTDLEVHGGSDCEKHLVADFMRSMLPELQVSAYARPTASPVLTPPWMVPGDHPPYQGADTPTTFPRRAIPSWY